MIGRSRASTALLLLCSLCQAAAGAGAAASQSKATRPRPRDSGKYQAWLEKEVRHELVLLPYYSVFDNLAFQVQDDRVILMGQVVRPTLRSDAEAQVRKIEGVASVVNQIEVLPLSPNDDRLRRQVFRAIYSSSGLERYALQAVPPIHIIVKGGNVTLEGVVASEADRNIANIRANGVPGVFSVTNHLQVEK